MDFRGFPNNNPSQPTQPTPGGLGGAAAPTSDGLGGATPYVAPAFEGADAPEPAVAPKIIQDPQPYVETVAVPTPAPVAEPVAPAPTPVVEPIVEPVAPAPTVETFVEEPAPVIATPVAEPAPVAEEAPVEEPVTETAEAEAPAEPEVVTEEPAIEEAVETVSVGLSSVIDAINGLNEKIDGMNDLFAKKMMHTTHEEKIVDQMHAELQKYKEDLYAQLIRPVLIDIIGIRDSIKRNVKIIGAKPEEEQKIDLKFFGDYAYDLEDILDKNNVIIYSSKEGDTFTAIRQKVIKKIPTPVEELHGKVAESVSDGYEYGGRIIVPEKVDVYLYEAPQATEGEN